MNHYEALGVEPSATTEEIARAYRKKCLKQHPDLGGSPEEFKALRIAYDTLRDDESRRYYDETGEQPGDYTVVQTIVAGMLHDAFRQELQDPISFMCRRVDESRFKIKQLKQDSLKHRQRLSRRLARFESANVLTKNKKARAFIAGQLRARIAQFDEEIESHESELALANDVLTFLNDLSCPSGFGGEQTARASWPPPVTAPVRRTL